MKSKLMNFDSAKVLTDKGQKAVVGGSGGRDEMNHATQENPVFQAQQGA